MEYLMPRGVLGYSLAGVEAISRILHSGDFYTADHGPGGDWDVQIGVAGIRSFAWAILLQGANLVQLNGIKNRVEPYRESGFEKTGPRRVENDLGSLVKNYANS